MKKKKKEGKEEAFRFAGNGKVLLVRLTNNISNLEMRSFPSFTGLCSHTPVQRLSAEENGGMEGWRQGLPAEEAQSLTRSDQTRYHRATSVKIHSDIQ